MNQKNYIYGLHSTLALLENSPDSILCLYTHLGRDEKIKPHLSLAKRHHIVIECKKKAELDKLVSGNHQGIVALCQPYKVYNEADLKVRIEQAQSVPLVLVLDGVQDPHNLGACLRTADALGVTAIVAPKDNSVGLTPVVAKVASGALTTIPFVPVTNLVRTMEALKKLGLWIYGADEKASATLYQTDLRIPIALVLGAEGRGLRRLTREHCDGLVRIPMLGTVDSLNVSVAAGICLYEIVRQRLQGS